jgi:hypothetical protein
LSRRTGVGSRRRHVAFCLSHVCVRRSIASSLCLLHSLLHIPYSHVLEMPPMRALRALRPPRPAPVLATERLAHPRRYTRGLLLGEARLACTPRVISRLRKVIGLRTVPSDGYGCTSGRSSDGYGSPVCHPSSVVSRTLTATGRVWRRLWYGRRYCMVYCSSFKPNDPFYIIEYMNCLTITAGILQCNHIQSAKS